MKKYVKFIVSTISLFAINMPLSAFSTIGDAKFNILQNIISNEINYNTMLQGSETDTSQISLLKKLTCTILPYADEKILFDQAQQQPDKANTDTTIIAQNNDISDGNYHNGNPLILIYHTHTTESYCEDISSNVYRNTDNNKNMVMIGDIVAKVLYEEYGIEVLHLRETFDVPYDGAYDRSLEAAQQRIASYPSIKYSFDIHRDGLSATEEGKKIYSTDIEGVASAKVMIVLGNQADNYPDNLAFSELLSSHMQSMYPPLYRSTIEKQYKYNQFITDKCLLFEVGSNLSTYEEAQNSAVFLARSLANAVIEDSSQ